MALRRSPPSSMPSTSVRRSCAVHFVSPKATITRGVNVALRRRVATDNAACGAREHAAASRPATVAATRTARTTPLGMGVWHWGLFVAAPIRHSGDAVAGIAEAGAPAPVLGLTLPHAWRNTWDNQRGRRALGKDVRAHEEGLWTGSGVGVGSGVPGDSSPHFTRWDDTCLNDSLARAAPDPQLPARGRRKALRVPRPFLPVAIVANNNLGRGTWTVGVPHNLRPWDKRVVCANQLTFLMPMQVVHKVQVIASVTIGMYEADISIVARNKGSGGETQTSQQGARGQPSAIQSLERRAGGWRFPLPRLFRLLEVPTSPGNYSRVTTSQLELKSEKSVLGLWNQLQFGHAAKAFARSCNAAYLTNLRKPPRTAAFVRPTAHPFARTSP